MRAVFLSRRFVFLAVLSLSLSLSLTHFSLARALSQSLSLPPSLPPSPSLSLSNYPPLPPLSRSQRIGPGNRVLAAVPHWGQGRIGRLWPVRRATRTGRCPSRIGKSPSQAERCQEYPPLARPRGLVMYVPPESACRGSATRAATRRRAMTRATEPTGHAPARGRRHSTGIR